MNNQTETTTTNTSEILSNFQFQRSGAPEAQIAARHAMESRINGDSSRYNSTTRYYKTTSALNCTTLYQSLAQ
jgi:hypothetical protein